VVVGIGAMPNAGPCRSAPVNSVVISRNGLPFGLQQSAVRQRIVPILPDTEFGAAPRVAFALEHQFDATGLTITGELEVVREPQFHQVAQYPHLVVARRQGRKSFEVRVKVRAYASSST
jgi:hypothetical protein